MKHLFIPYELAVLAKEKGFNEPCLALYNREKALRVSNLNNPKDRNKDFIVPNNSTSFPAPLYQQTIDWFRDVHKIHFYITPYGGETEKWYLANIGYTNKRTEDGRLFYDIRDKYREIKFDTYYQALNEAITEAFKLI